MFKKHLWLKLDNGNLPRISNEARRRLLPLLVAVLFCFVPYYVFSSTSYHFSFPLCHSPLSYHLSPLSSLLFSIPLSFLFFLPYLFPLLSLSLSLASPPCLCLPIGWCDAFRLRLLQFVINEKHHDKKSPMQTIKEV